MGSGRKAEVIIILLMIATMMVITMTARVYWKLPIFRNHAKHIIYLPRFSSATTYVGKYYYYHYYFYFRDEKIEAQSD